MIAAFWSPVHGQTTTTSNLTAAASVMAISYDAKVLITHSHLQRSTLERNFLSMRTDVDIRKESSGMDAIKKLIYSGLLKEEHIRDNSEGLLKNRLDLLPGLGFDDSETLEKIMPVILKSAQRYYDIAMIDVPSGNFNKVTAAVLKQADLVVVSLNQNAFVLSQFFKDKEQLALLEGKKVLYCIGAFDRHSKMSVTRICKEYRLKEKEVSVVPYSTRFMDAQNSSNVLDYIVRASGIKKPLLEIDPDQYFISSVQNMVGKMIKSLELQVMKEGSE